MESNRYSVGSEKFDFSRPPTTYSDMLLKWLRFSFMVFNATFNNISVISWRSVILLEQTKVPGEIHRPVESRWQSLSHDVVSSTPRHERGSNSHIYWW